MQAGKRQIQSGKAYDSYFPKAKGLKQIIIKEGGSVEQTVALCQKIVSETLSDTKKIAPLLLGKSYEETARNIWQFIITHVQYTLDNRAEDVGAVERVRTPARTWHDRQAGADCEDYSIFISSVLTNLGIPHSFRITKYNGKSNWQHIYVVIPRENNGGRIHGGYITCDPVVDYRFNYEVPYSQKRDYQMPVLHKRMGLSGLNDSRAANHTLCCTAGIDAADFADPASLFGLPAVRLPIDANKVKTLSGVAQYATARNMTILAGTGALLYFLFHKKSK
jgi:predicted transglutaminase-like cysteine proteinase